MIVVLAKAIEADARVVLAFYEPERALAAGVKRAAIVLRGNGKVVRVRVIVRAIEMVEGRNGEQQTGIEGAHPGEIDERIRLDFSVAQAVAIGIAGIVRNLVEIAAS